MNKIYRVAIVRFEYEGNAIVAEHHFDSEEEALKCELCFKLAVSGVADFTTEFEIILVEDKFIPESFMYEFWVSKYYADDDELDPVTTDDIEGVFTRLSENLYQLTIDPNDGEPYEIRCSGAIQAESSQDFVNKLQKIIDDARISSLKSLEK
jgi:hypothetical protein